MPKYEIALTFYREVEASNIDEAADIADYEKSRLVDNGLAGDLGWEQAVTKVKRSRKVADIGDVAHMIEGDN
jgi:hypothetical protein